MAKPTETPAPIEAGLNSRVPFYVLALIVLVFAIVRVRTMNIPLERDEGEYAYAGQLLLQGIPPYKLAFNMKLPGTYLAYALIMAVFGQTGAGIHAGLLVVNSVSIILVFLLTRRLLDSLAALVASASYAILSAGPSVLGFAGHATHFLVLAGLAGILLLLRAMEKRRAWELVLSGVLLGLAFLMKQPGLFLIFFGFLYLVKTQFSDRVGWRTLFLQCSAFLAGAALPFLLTCLWLWKAGVFGRFWFWTFTYGRLYGTMVSLHDAFGIFLTNSLAVIRPEAGIWIIAAVGLVVLWWRRNSSALFLTGFLAFSFLAVCPGFYFREHYFIVMLPAIAMLAGAAVSLMTRELRDRSSKLLRAVPVLVFLTAFGLAFAHEWDFWFEMDPITASRSVYGPNPFPEAVEIAKFLRTHASPSASIAVLGSEPEICFYARRHSATGYIYTYPLMEEQPYALTMQQEMISQIEQAQPEFLVFVNVPTSWLRREGSQTLILQWTQKYVADHYLLDGMVDILGETHYAWEADARNYRPTSRYTVQIFKRTQP